MRQTTSSTQPFPQKNFKVKEIFQLRKPTIQNHNPTTLSPQTHHKKPPASNRFFPTPFKNASKKGKTPEQVASPRGPTFFLQTAA